MRSSTSRPRPGRFPPPPGERTRRGTHAEGVAWPAAHGPAPPSPEPARLGVREPLLAELGPKPKCWAPPPPFPNPLRRPGPPSRLPSSAARSRPPVTGRETEGRARRAYAQEFLGRLFPLSSSRYSGTLRVGRLRAPPDPRRGWDFTGIGQGAKAGPSAEGGCGAHSEPGSGLPGVGAVCLVPVSTLRVPRAFQSCHRPGHWLQTDWHAAGKTDRGAGPSQEGASPRTWARSQVVTL